jgi:hypothetical protein
MKCIMNYVGIFFLVFADNMLHYKATLHVLSLLIKKVKQSHYRPSGLWGSGRLRLQIF